MSWAARRRFIILLIIGAAVALVTVAALFALLYKAPSCSDGIQNQGEQGIDCGGPCPYLCTQDFAPPTVLFTKAIPNGPGRTDILAYIENGNAGAAARAVRYSVMLYGADHALIQHVTGSVDLPPDATVPVYVPGVASGKQPVASAFLTIDTASLVWFSYTETRTLPVYDNDATLSNAATAPRIVATVSNAAATPLAGVRAVVAVRDAAGNVMAASETLIASIPGHARANAVFTWNQPFPSAAASIEVLPIAGLP